MRKILWILGAAALLTACGGGRKPAAQEGGRPAAPKSFRAVTIPATIPSDQHRAFLREHYWDCFDFGDTLQLPQLDTVMMIRTFFNFITTLDGPTDRAPIDSLMRRVAVSEPMTRYFAMLAEAVLYDPNSPARNDELYIPVLEALSVSPWFDRWERLIPEQLLRTAMQNRVGHPANDFRYTTADGRSHRMYDLQADYLLLFINNPGCDLCQMVREAITESPMMNELIARGKLKVLAIYPDEDLTEWEAYRSQIPASWINAYDRGCVIRDSELYDLKAIPALYLLDRDKRVMVKDAVDVGLIEWAIDHDDRKN